MEDRIEILFSEKEIDERIRTLAQQLSREYEGKEITIICILKGATFFACELAKRLTVPVKIEFMRCSSYGDDTESSREVKILLDLDNPIKDKDVLVVEDIIDTGRTMKTLLEVLKNRGASSVKLCALLDKPDRREVEVHADYLGFTIPDKFVVGYGLDYAQKYRNLPYIGEVII
ncbi:MAG: hypoxanthine phosphoribosyltransferase [Lachnospiraceae bacterium]|nr:hypoxanthine phosphoribosyltransferase [Lachnospiraceae bacterium]